MGRFEDMGRTPARVGWAAAEHEAHRQAAASDRVAGSWNRSRRKAFAQAMRRFEEWRYGDKRRRGGNVQWPLGEGDARWVFSVEFEDREGVLECVAINVTSAAIRPGQRVTAEAFRTNRPVTAEAFRVPIATIINIARVGLERERREERQAELDAEHEHYLSTWKAIERRGERVKIIPKNVGWEELAGAAQGGRRRGAGRPPLTDELLDEVAQLYEEVVQSGAKPVLEVLCERLNARGQGKPRKLKTVEGLVTRLKKTGRI